MAWRTEHEAKVLRSLRHPWIPRYVDHGAPGPVAYLLMTRAPGQSLQQRMARGDRFSDAKLQHVLARLLEVLAYLHDLNPPVFHGDIHPEHVIVSGAGDVQLVSFGRARSLLAADPLPAVGRPGYAPPHDPHAGTAAADLYALGA
ncbi:MAG: hypothetical protein KDK70_43405, partial [Myxococcales bacterium]|nr:hypothetical protein [Myxococcales bacterium]